jgi:hypothetical protein
LARFTGAQISGDALKLASQDFTSGKQSLRGLKPKPVVISKLGMSCNDRLIRDLKLPFFEIAFVLVRFDHVASGIVDANESVLLFTRMKS